MLHHRAAPREVKVHNDGHVELAEELQLEQVARRLPIRLRRVSLAQHKIEPLTSHPP